MPLPLPHQPGNGVSTPRHARRPGGEELDIAARMASGEEVESDIVACTPPCNEEDHAAECPYSDVAEEGANDEEGADDAEKGADDAEGGRR